MEYVALGLPPTLGLCSKEHFLAVFDKTRFEFVSVVNQSSLDSRARGPHF